MTYREVLKKEGMAESRIDDLWDGFDKLHLAISKLDCQFLRMFWSKDLVTRLSEFAKSEDLRDVTPIGEECKLR